jgi:hypothetical protein
MDCATEVCGLLYNLVFAVVDVRDKIIEAEALGRERPRRP